MSKQQKFALGTIVAIGLFLFIGTVGPMLFDCDSVGLHRSDSPDGQYRVAIGVQTCKDSTQNAVWLFFYNMETGSNVRSTLIKDTSITDFEVTWQGNDALKITVPTGVDLDDLRGRSSFESVRIEYRTHSAAPVESSK